MKKYIIVITLWVLPFFNGQLFGQGYNPPPGGRVGNYKNHFSYFSKDNTDKPAGSAQVSDALMVINNGSGNGTAFPVNSYREDKKICVCTAGHVVENLSLGKHEIDIYMKFLGKSADTALGTGLENYGWPISSFKSTMHLELVDKLNSSTLGDWAILLADPDELPVRDYATLPYVFNNQLYANTPPAKYYIMGHPWSTPQRIADSLSYVTGLRQYSTATPFVLLDAHNERKKPGGMAEGASGSPVMNSYLAIPAVVGIYNGTISYLFDGRKTVPLNEIPPVDLKFSYPNDFKYTDDSHGVTKFNAPELMAAIKKHCWAKADSAAIESDMRYKTGVQHDNTEQVNEFGTAKAITSQAGLVAAADQSYAAGNPGAALLKASTLTLSCTVTTNTSLSRISGLAKEIAMNAGFEYTATGNYQLDMNTVVPEMVTSSTMSISAKENAADTTGNASAIATDTGESTTATDALAFKVYPNPSSNGTFHLSLKQAADPYRIEVFTTKGVCVYVHKIAPGSNIHTLHLNGLSHGSYILRIYNESSGKQLFNKVIVYL